MPESTSQPDASILVVEDHRETRTYLDLALADGYEVDSASDATTALEMTKETNYDLLLVDIALHDNIDGTELARQLRERPEYAETPMIGMTAHQMNEERGRSLRQGFDEFLSKPFYPEDLLEAIEELLDGDSDAGTSPHRPQP